MFEEIEGIPELLESLEPKERLEMIIKLMNYVMPKVNPINSNKGEPIQWDPMIN